MKWFVLLGLCFGVTCGGYSQNDIPMVGEAVAQTVDEVTVPETILRGHGFYSQGKVVDLTLEEAIQVAKKQNPNLRVARSGLEGSFYDLDLTESAYRTLVDLNAIAEENLTQRAGGTTRFDPELGVIRDVGRISENDEFVNVGTGVRKTFRNGVSVNLNPSFDYVRDTERAFDIPPGSPVGNRDDFRSRINADITFPLNSRPRLQIDTDIENAELDVVRSDYNLFILQEQVQQQVIDTYWNIKQTQEALDITRERWLQAKQIEFVLRVQYENEREALVNVQQAEVDTLNQEATFIQQEGALLSNIEQFNILLGTPVDTQLQLTNELAVEPLPMSSEEYIGLITSTNLEIKDLQLGIQQLENNLRVTRLGQQPELSLSSSFFRDDEGAQTATIGLIFNWPIIDGGATKARVRALQETLEQQRINLWNLERQLVQEAFEDLRELQLQDQRINILTLNVEQARATLDNALIQFREFGRITFRDMQDFQIDLATSRNSLVQARVLFNRARSSLLQKVHHYSPDQRVSPFLDGEEDNYLLDFLR